MYVYIYIYICHYRVYIYKRATHTYIYIYTAIYIYKYIVTSRYIRFYLIRSCCFPNFSQRSQALDDEARHEMNLAKAPWVEPMVSRKMIDCLVVKNIGLNGGSWLRKASITGWWFGTWILWLSIYREFHNLNWRTPSFFRGAETTKMIYIHYHSLWLSIWDMVRINLFYFFRVHNILFTCQNMFISRMH